MAHNDDQLQRFKSEINLIEYAESQGYYVAERESSKASTVMRSDDGDKIVIGTDTDGHYIYFSVRDASDNGSIIDFIQKRQGLNLGKVRAELRPWLSGRQVYTPKSPPALRVKPAATSKDRQKIAIVWANAAAADGRHAYLENVRKIDPSMLRDPRFATMFKAGTKGSALFPHYDELGLCGYEIKNVGFTGFAAGGEKALWHSTNLHRASTVAIVESAIDAISHAELFPNQNVAYVSIGGQMSPKQLQLLQGVLQEAQARNAGIHIATDNDKGGDGLEATIRSLTSAKCARHRPLGKDWNQDLIDSKSRTEPPINSVPDAAPAKPDLSKHPLFIPTTPTTKPVPKK